MDSGSDASASILFVFLLFQLVLLLVVLLGGVYALYCLNKAAGGLTRLATVAEAWLAHQTRMDQARFRQNATPPATVENGPAAIPVIPAPPSTPETPVPPVIPTVPPVPATETPSQL